MELTPWDPWSEWARLRAETDRMWDAFFRRLAAAEAAPEGIGFIPDADLIETRDQYRLYLSAPGMIEEDIEMLIEPDSLVVRGERQPPYDPARAQSRLREWRYGWFQRRFEFPRPVRPGTLRARYEEGVLTIVVEKAAGEKDEPGATSGPI